MTLRSRLSGFWSKHEWWLFPACLALTFFLAQLTQINAYGVTWDEPLHRNWGKIFMYFWRTGDRRFLDMMPGHGINYGPTYYILNYVLSGFLYRAHLLSFVASNHILNIVTASVGVALVFLAGRSVGGRRTGGLAALFLICFPPFIAHAHYNPKDIPLMVAVLLTVIVFLRALKTNGGTWLVIAGFLMGCSIAIKVSAVLMGPAFAASYLVWLWQREHSFGTALKKNALRILGTCVAVAAGAIVLWPSAWGDLALIPDSIRFFLTSNFWPGRELFFGTEYPGAELPWYYTPFEYLAVMPVLSIVFLVAGMEVVLLRLRRRQHLPQMVLLVLWILVPILVSMKPGLVRYDGMRQFFFTLPAVTILCAIGFDAVLKAFWHRFSRPWVASLIVLIVSLSFTHEIAIVHPYEGSYRNELMRAVYPKQMDLQFPIEYWGPTYKEGMEWLVRNAEPNPVICVPTAGVLIDWYAWREDFAFDCTKDSNYIMFFTRYSETQQYALENTASPAFVISRMGADLLKIYKVK